MLLNKVWLYSRNVLALKEKDVFLVSFPKSGNTWIRFYLCNLINQFTEHHFTDEPINFEMLDKVMVELGTNNLAKKWQFPGFPRIIKTHLPYSSILGKRKTILVIRDPRDVMVSFYKFETMKVQNSNRRFKSDDFKKFIEHPKFGIESWCKHYLSWKPYAGLIIKYEDLKLDDKTILAKVNQYLDIHSTEEQFKDALELSRFENIKKIEDTKGDPSLSKRFGTMFQFTRSGKTGQWMDFFSPEDLEFLTKTLDRYSIKLYNY